MPASGSVEAAAGGSCEPGEAGGSCVLSGLFAWGREPAPRRRSRYARARRTSGRGPPGRAHRRPAGRLVAGSPVQSGGTWLMAPFAPAGRPRVLSRVSSESFQRRITCHFSGASRTTVRPSGSRRPRPAAGPDRRRRSVGCFHLRLVGLGVRAARRGRASSRSASWSDRLSITLACRSGDGHRTRNCRS